MEGNPCKFLQATGGLDEHEVTSSVGSSSLAHSPVGSSSLAHSLVGSSSSEHSLVGSSSEHSPTCFYRSVYVLHLSVVGASACDRESEGIITGRLRVIRRVEQSSGGHLHVIRRVEQSSGSVCDREGVIL